MFWRREKQAEIYICVEIFAPSWFLSILHFSHMFQTLKLILILNKENSSKYIVQFLNDDLI